MNSHPSSADLQQWIGRAIGCFRQGNLAEAERLCSDVLASLPADFQAAHLLGVIRAQQGRNSEALALIGDALKTNPQAAEALLNYGTVLKALGRNEEALAYCDKALAIKPDSAGVLYNRGNVLMRLGRLDEALASYDAALTIRPGHAELLNNRGMVLRDLGRLDEALASYDKAVAIKPDYAEALLNRANLLRDVKRFDAAVASYDRTLALNPDNAEALTGRGACLYYLKRLAQSLASYDAAVAIKPDHVDALHGRASIRWKEGQHYEAAVSDLEKVVSLNPDYDYALGDLLHLRMHGTDWSTFEQQVALVEAGVRAGKRVVDPFIYQAISQSPADLQACSEIFARHYYPPAPALWKKTGRGRGKIRLGYVSGEFRAQATAFLAAGLYECHDKSRFEIVAFDCGWSTDSPMRRRLEAAFDRFIPIAHLSDPAAAEKIVAEDIDILVNLNGYFGDHRTGVFAQRPAPVQVSYLGFPATLGAGYIDYILADRFVIPENDKRYYTEKVVWLPDSYQVNDSRRHLASGAASRSAHQLPEAAFVFCNFNVSYKLTPAIFAVWMRILKGVEGSVLWLLQSNAASPDNLRREAARHGVAGDRLVFAPFVPMEQQLDRLQLADLFLDCLPYNAHTTASDALWAGVPLVTCRGTAFPGRVATSLLQAMDLPELVTENLDDYEALAVRLAHDPALLQAIRQKLARNRQTAPLFDTDRFRRHLESAYARMWEMFARGEAPASFAVEPV